MPSSALSARSHAAIFTALGFDGSTIHLSCPIRGSEYAESHHAGQSICASALHVPKITCASGNIGVLATIPINIANLRTFNSTVDHVTQTPQ